MRRYKKIVKKTYIIYTKFVNAEEIVGRQLQVVVPNVTLSEAQINAVNNATKHGIDKGVKLIITVGK